MAEEPTLKHLNTQPTDKGRSISEQAANKEQLAQGNFIAQASRGSTATVAVYQTATTIKDQNRQRMLERMYTRRISGFLEHSLSGAALLAPGLQEQATVVLSSWRLATQNVDAPTQPLPANTSITRIYDAAEAELLILGEPGSGKTTLLVELARNLLERAQRDTSLPIPVIFNLSSWPLNCLSLADWLVEELYVEYQVPHKVGRSWIENDQIMPLLDGLDEVSSAYRAACVNTINHYRSEHGLTPTVVCCRTSDYLSLPTRLLLRRAITVQPLSHEQVDEYLASAGKQLASLRRSLHNDPLLQELATTPLMLSVLALTYRGKSTQDLLGASSAETLRRHIFDTYIQRMLGCRGAQASYTQQQTKNWLCWLARQLKQHGLTELYIERMQPDWIEDPQGKRVYQFFAVVLPRFLIGVLTSIMVTLWFLVPFSPYILVLYGLLGGWIGGFYNRGQNREVNAQSWKHKLLSLIDDGHLRNGLLIGGLVGLSSLPAFEWHVGFLIFALDNALFFGLIAAFLSIILFRITGNIQPAETIVWSWNSFKQSLMNAKHLRNGFLAGGLSGLLVGLPYGSGSNSNFNPDRLNFNLRSGGIGALSALFLYGLSYWLLIGLFNGLSSDSLDSHRLVVPNQGIRRSGRNSLWIGLISGCFIGCTYLINSMIYWWIIAYLGFPHSGLSDAVRTGLIGALIIALISGLLAGLLRGGLAYIQHFILRLQLWLARSTPRNYIRFLDYAAEHILLRKVGGGYVFVHRLLLEHFTTINDSYIQPVPAAATHPPDAKIGHLLPCGHGGPPNAHFCGICGKPVPPASTDPDIFPPG